MLLQVKNKTLSDFAVILFLNLQEEYQNFLNHSFSGSSKVVLKCKCGYLVQEILGIEKRYVPRHCTHVQCSHFTEADINNPK